jgi:RHS repeat-associated protein
VQGKPVTVKADNTWQGTASVTSGTNTVTVVATDPSGNVRTNTYEVSTAGTAKTFTYDANGNLTSDGTRSFEWDARDQLVAITVSTQRTEFAYDGEQRRVRIVEKDNDVTQSEATAVWCDSALCEERTSTGATVTRRLYRYGEQLGGSDRSFVHDHLGTVNAVTDTSAAILGRYRVDPWGRRTLAAGADVTRSGFTGHQWQSSGSIWLTLYRAYDPDLGRWISRDPSGFADGPNDYTYVGGDPVGSVDPDGLQRRRLRLPKTVRCLTLRLIVLLSCKRKAAQACLERDSCDELRAKITLKVACIAAQQRLSKECFPKHETHQQRITDVQNQIKRCRDLLAKKEANCECK